MEFRKQDDKGYFNDVEAVIVANGVYISPYINNHLYVYVEPENLIIDIEYFELLRLLASMKKTELKLVSKRIEHTRLGIVLVMNFEESINIKAIIDWGIQTITSAFNDKISPIRHGPDCEYNDCLYTELNYLNNFLYFLKIRVTENSVEPALYKISVFNFVNELVFYELHQKFKLI